MPAGPAPAAACAFPAPLATPTKSALGSRATTPLQASLAAANVTAAPSPPFPPSPAHPPSGADLPFTYPVAMRMNNLKGVDLVDVNDSLQAVFGNGLWVEPVAGTEREYW